MSLFEVLSNLANRHLDEQRRARLRAVYLKTRTRLNPLLKLVNGSFDAVALRDHLAAHLGDDFTVLMVHSSMNNMAPMYTGTPLDLVRMLIDFVGPERTLVMPAFYFGDPKIGGNLATFLANPRFDLRRTPSQMGLATELFRSTKGVVQSRHPVYRVAALGPLAGEICAGHENADTPAGPGTPFETMYRHDARVLGIGKPIDVLTQVHYVEDSMGLDFPASCTRREPHPVTVVVDGNTEVQAALNGYEVAWRRDMFRLRHILPAGIIDEWQFHRVPMFTTRAKPLVEALFEAAGRGDTVYAPPPP